VTLGLELWRGRVFGAPGAFLGWPDLNDWAWC
jgi:hypothetical protein